MCKVNDLEIRYRDLLIKARHIPLTEVEFEECEKIQEQLGIEACDICEGRGDFGYVESPAGGFEETPCKHCYGTGTKNLSEYLIEELRWDNL